MPHLQDSDSDDTNSDNSNHHTRHVCRQNSDSSGRLMVISTTPSTASSVSPTTAMMTEVHHSPLPKHHYKPESHSTPTRGMMVLNGADRLLSLAATATKHSSSSSNASQSVVTTVKTSASSARTTAPYQYHPSVDEDDEDIIATTVPSKQTTNPTMTTMTTSPNPSYVPHSSSTTNTPTTTGISITPSPYNSRKNSMTNHQDTGPMMSIYGNNARLFPSPIRVKNSIGLSQGRGIPTLTNRIASFQESTTSSPLVTDSRVANPKETSTTTGGMNHPSNLKYGVNHTNHVGGERVQALFHDNNNDQRQTKRLLESTSDDQEYHHIMKKQRTIETFAIHTSDNKNKTVGHGALQSNASNSAQQEKQFQVATTRPDGDHLPLTADKTNRTLFPTVLEGTQTEAATVAPKKKPIISPASSHEKIDDEESLPSQRGAPAGPSCRSYHPHSHPAYPPHIAPPPYHYPHPPPPGYHGAQLLPPTYGHFHMDPTASASMGPVPPAPVPYYLPYPPMPPHMAAATPAGHAPMMQHYRSHLPHHAQLPHPSHYGAFRGSHPYHPRHHAQQGGPLHGVVNTSSPSKQTTAPSVSLSVSSSPNQEMMQQAPGLSAPPHPGVPPSSGAPSPGSMAAGNITRLYHPHAPPAPISTGAASTTTAAVGSSSGGIQSVADWQRATLATGKVPSAKRCVPLKEPIPSKYWGEAEKTKDAVLPDFHRLVNYPDYLAKPRSSSSPSSSGTNSPSSDANSVAVNNANGRKNCVMCGKLRVCSATSLVKSGAGRGGVTPRPSKASSAGTDNASPTNSAVDDEDPSTTHIIPRQNKGLCTACDVTVWVVVADGLEIKWCKGCKNFRPWAAFGDKGSATKCVRCRDRQREKYAMQKDEIRLRRYNNSKSPSKDTSKPSSTSTNKSSSSSVTVKDKTSKVVMKTGWEEKKDEDHHLAAARGLRNLMHAAATG